MKEAVDKLMDKREKQFNNGNYGLIVITDGEANNEADWLVNSKLARDRGRLSYIDEIKSRGIKISAIGVSMDKAHTLATEVPYRSAEDPESFARAVKESVSEVSISSAAKTFEGSGFDGDISGFPSEVALAVVEAISTVQNHPIGTKPKPKPVAAPPVATAQAPASTAPAADTQTGTQQSAQPAHTHGGHGLFLVLLLVGVVVLVFFASIFFR